MGITAENLATDYAITRQMSDEYAVQSQARYQEAKEKGEEEDYRIFRTGSSRVSEPMLQALKEVKGGEVKRGKAPKGHLERRLADLLDSDR